ncbi:hypothetical protein GMMP15_1860014 [Candidatus Magnetomoraceae bacterium gMMP-15]
MDKIMNTQRKPAHPGRILKNFYLKPLSFKITKLSEMLGVSRKVKNKDDIVNLKFWNRKSEKRRYYARHNKKGILKNQHKTCGIDGAWKFSHT